MSATRYPGTGRPIEPGRTAWPGVFAIMTVVSVWPKPSRIVTPHTFCTCSMTSGFSGSPAPTATRGGVDKAVRSDWMSIRHTVGGAQKLVTPHRCISPSSRGASNRV
jgi:hypothetical protein